MPRFPFLPLALAASIPLAVGIASCSGAEATGLIVAVQTDLSISKDFDELGLYVTVDGRLVFSQQYPFDAAGRVHLPSTLAVRPSDNAAAVVAVRAVAFRKGEARVLRQSITTIPHERVAVLRLPLEWLAAGTSTKGSVADYVAKPFAPERNLCANNVDTSEKGICIASSIAVDSLPTYNPAEVFGGGDESGAGGGCFAVGACFASSVKLPVDPDCTVPFAGSAGSINVAVATTTGEGEPVGGDDLVVLNQSAWSVSSGRIHLPAALCQAPKKSEVKAIVLATACAPKTEKFPICGPFSTGTPLPLLGDAGPLPIVDGGSDASLPLIEDFGSSETDVGSVAVGPTYVYAVGSDPNKTTSFRLIGYDKAGPSTQSPAFIIPLTGATVTRSSAAVAVNPNAGKLVVAQSLLDATSGALDLFALDASGVPGKSPQSFVVEVDNPAVALSPLSIFHPDVTDVSLTRRSYVTPAVADAVGFSGIPGHVVSAIRFADSPPVVYVGTHDGWLFRVDTPDDPQIPITTTLLTDMDTVGQTIGAIAVVPGGNQLVLSLTPATGPGEIITVPSNFASDGGAPDAGVPVTILAPTEDLTASSDVHGTRYRGVGADAKYAYFASDAGLRYVPLAGGPVTTLKAGVGVYGVDLDPTHVYWTAMDDSLPTGLHKGIGRALLIP